MVQDKRFYLNSDPDYFDCLDKCVGVALSLVKMAFVLIDKRHNNGGATPKFVKTSNLTAQWYGCHATLQTHARVWIHWEWHLVSRSATNHFHQNGVGLKFTFLDLSFKLRTKIFCHKDRNFTSTIHSVVCSSFQGSRPTFFTLYQVGITTYYVFN